MDSFTIEAFTLLGVGLAVIFLRTGSRIHSVGVKGLKADDYLMLIAAVTYSIETALAYTVGAYWRGLANNGMTDEERAALDPDSQEFRLRVNGSKTQIAGWSTYTFLLWVLKAAMCTYYLRLCEGLRHFRIRIYVGFGLIFFTWVAVLLSILFGCYPLQKNWQIFPDPGNFCQPAISRIDIFVTVVLNVVTDLYLLSIPIPMLWSSTLPPLKKAGLIILFSGGIFVTMAGILRCVLIITNPVTGAQQAGSWACRETFVAVITTNLPMVFPLFKKALSPIIGSLSSTFSRNSSKHSHSSKQSDHSRNGSYKVEKPEKKGHHYSQYPITNFTMSESEEHINEPRGIRREVEIHVESEAKSIGSEEANIEGNGTYAHAVGKKSLESRRKDRRSSYYGKFPGTE